MIIPLYSHAIFLLLYKLLFSITTKLMQEVMQ